MPESSHPELQNTKIRAIPTMTMPIRKSTHGLGMEVAEACPQKHADGCDSRMNDPGIPKSFAICSGRLWATSRRNGAKGGSGLRIGSTSRQ